MSENLSVSARTTRLNSLILGRAEALPKEQKEICNGISRDGLLDALFVLYDECNKDAVKKKSKHIQDFTIKCKLMNFAKISILSLDSYSFRSTNNS
jgi:citron Rho-interacting kinase